ncbi:hypothetical protein FIBSPDRAFT_871556 [Athelia psychrophila]|uniref:Uncharacterized protein n=1 Tax=Athelia psychrophila TaxID=1759441 RepID=A0A166A8Z9_9AGAM|nr:hypothetical protein FIBSPDRAFT_871556 [Fibularhizoctonia sp. CBS 109695]
MRNASKFGKAAPVGWPTSADVYAGGCIPEIRTFPQSSAITRGGDMLRMLYCAPEGLRLAAVLNPAISESRGMPHFVGPRSPR